MRRTASLILLSAAAVLSSGCAALEQRLGLTKDGLSAERTLRLARTDVDQPPVGSDPAAPAPSPTASDPGVPPLSLAPPPPPSGDPLAGPTAR